jgi:hypothetical protein
MTDDRDRPDPDADTWSAWLPRFDPTADTTGAAAPAEPPAGPPSGPSTDLPAPRVPPGPPLPQSSGPPVPAAPVPAQQSYLRSARPAAVGRAPRSHLTLAIVTLFVGLPYVSIAAVVAAAMVRSRWRRGNVVGAQRASRAALLLSIAALVLRVVWGIVHATFIH